MSSHAVRVDDARRSTDRQSAFARADRHSRRVRRLKLWLPGMAIVGIAGFVAWSYLSVPLIEGVEMQGAAVTDGKLVMANPKIDGFTKENLPYTMTAARAVQDLKNTSVITLEDIDAKVPVNAENTAKIVAQSGVFDNTANTLVIDTPVTVTTSDGMTANLRSASLDIGAGLMSTADPVEILLDGSRIEANSMHVTENGKVLVFERAVRVDIDPKKADPAPQGDRADASD